MEGDGMHGSMGPSTLPSMHSLARYSFTISGCSHVAGGALDVPLLCLKAYPETMPGPVVPELLVGVYCQILIPLLPESTCSIAFGIAVWGWGAMMQHHSTFFQYIM